MKKKKWGNLNEQLADAAFVGDAARVRELLDVGVDPNTPDDLLEWTVLMKVAWHENIEIVRLLLDYGADPNARDITGNGAFLSAVQYGQTEIAKLLIERGADKNAADKEGYTPLITVCRHPRNGYPINKRKIIKMLILLGVNMNATDNYGSTALIHLASEGYTGLIKLLIEAGADPYIRNNQGITAFDILEEYYPDKYDRLIQDIVIKPKKQILKKEDSAKETNTGYEFDI